QHRGGRLAGVGAGFFPVHVLRAEIDVRAGDGIAHGLERRERGANHDIDVLAVGEVALDLRRERLRFRERLVHLPVGSDNLLSHGENRGSRFLLDNAAPPGSSLPSRNSRLAPPRVLMCEILSARPLLLIAATLSPPPMILVPLISETALATVIVPLANGS